MNKRNKDLLKLNRLFKKLTAAVFYLGASGLNRGGEKIFLRDMLRLDTNLYVLNSYRSRNCSIGYRTFYCGVNAYIPPEFKNYWISDHHFLSVYYGIGLRSLNVVPHNGELYTVQFKHISIPYGIEIKDIQRYFNNHILIDGVKSWIELFFLNNDEEVLFKQGMVFPEFSLFNRDKLNEIVKIYQISNGIKHVADSRSRLSNALEKIIASII